jgi:hypothetical protein
MTRTLTTLLSSQSAGHFRGVLEFFSLGLVDFNYPAIRNQVPPRNISNELSNRSAFACPLMIAPSVA